MALFAPCLAPAAPEMALTLPFLAVTMTNVTLNICPSLPGFLSPLEAIMACLGSGGFWGLGELWGDCYPKACGVMLRHD